MISFIIAMVRHKWLTFSLLGLSLIAAGFAASTIRVRFQYRDFYAYEANQHLQSFDRYNEQFGDPGGSVILLIKSDKSIFNPETLHYIEALTKDLEPNPLFKRIRSLSSTNLLRADGEDVAAGRIMEQVPETPEGLNKLEALVLGSHLLSPRLVSKDKLVTAILAETRVPSATATVAEQREALAAVREVLSHRPPPGGLQATITGGPAIEVAVTESLLRDQMVLTPAVVGVVVVMLLLMFRTWHGVLLVLTTVGVSIVWTAGLFGLIGRPVDIVSSIIPTTLLAYGVVDPVFVLTRYFEKLEKASSKEQAIRETLTELLLPCFLTSLTTALGFAAFITATMPTVRYLGLVVGAGICFAFITTVAVMPLLLDIVPAPKRKLAELPLHGWVQRTLQKGWAFVVPKSRWFIALAFTGVVLAATAASGVQIDDAYVDTAPAGETRTSARVVEQSLGGVLRYSVYFRGPKDSMKHQDVLDAIARVDAEAEKLPTFNTSLSLSDVMAEANQAFFGGDISARTLPKSSALIAQYLALIDPVDRGDYVNEDYSESHIHILAKDQGGAKARDLRQRLQQIVDAQQFSRFNVEATVTGNAVVTYRELDRIAEEIVWGFVVAFAIVLVFELLLFRSLRVTLASIIPNLLPMGACMVAMRLSGIGFRLDTSLVMCISIGGVFTTTIHLVAKTLHQLRANRELPIETALANSLGSVGPASFYTAVTLAVSFSTLGLSQFPGLRVLGGLVLLTMATGFACDAILTPTFVKVLLRPRTPGPTPQRHVRLDEAVAHNP